MVDKYHELRCLWGYRNQIVLVLTPLVLLALPLYYQGDDFYEVAVCAYVLLLMVVYWLMEILPIPATSLIPVFLFPLLGVLKLSVVCNQFLNTTIMMFSGGLMVAIAVEKCNLHKRIALFTIMHVGTTPHWLMAGFMFPTWFLSMWISNTATTAMMLPIMEAVLDNLEGPKDENIPMTEPTLRDHINNNSHAEGGVDNPAYTPSIDGQPATDQDSTTILTLPDNGAPGGTPVNREKADGHTAIRTLESIDEHDTSAERLEESQIRKTKKDKKDFKHYGKGMTLAIAHAATCGGIGTLIGSPPNIIAKDYADSLYQEKGFDESPINFGYWMGFGFPIATISVVFVWLWLATHFIWVRNIKCKSAKNDPQMKAKDDAVRRYIRNEYRALGTISFAEVMVTILFTAMVLLWFFRSPRFIDGWSDLPIFKKGYNGDAVVSISITFLCFCIPSKIPRCGANVKGKVDCLLDWDIVHKKFPWGIIFLMGGGFSLAKGCQESGLSGWLGDQFDIFAEWPDWALILIVSFLVASLTEVTSNSATCTLLMPIVATMSTTMGKSPLFLMLPSAVSTSFAFMLPVATPPNAIAFSYGRLKIMDMVKGGIILNIGCVFLVTLATVTWGQAMFDLQTLPWSVDPVLNMTAST